jgi:hypothetical protein
MTTDPTFVHPAQDPPGDVTERARRRVGHTIRRRRARRRAVGSAALVAVVVAGATGIIGLTRTGGGGDDGGDVVADGGVDDPDIKADTEWSDPLLSEDERTLTIDVGSSGPGDTACHQNFEHEVIETEDSVTVEFDEQQPPPPVEGEEVVCTDMLDPQTFEVELAAPLGDRTLHDGVRPEALVVHHLAEVVEVTHLPDGFTAEGPGIGGVEQNGWQQTFHRDGADWYFAVIQQPEADAVVPEGTPTPVTVNGIAAQRYSGQMNGTMETIRWTQDGVTIDVWGEMQGPPAFTRSAELLQIAEGVRLPAP